MALLIALKSDLDTARKIARDFSISPLHFMSTLIFEESSPLVDLEQCYEIIHKIYRLIVKAEQITCKDVDFSQ